MTSAWDRDAVRSRFGHVLQSEAWGRIRATQGWTPEELRVGDTLPVALVLWRRLPLGQTIGYVPRGPTFDHDDVQQLDREGHTRSSRSEEHTSELQSRPH